jgi:riboflavin synthase
MFTGIIEELGTVERVGGGEIVLRAATVLEGTRLGDSIAVNGVCLTVTRLTSAGFTADVMPETLRRSSLGNLRPGSQVNLERAMAADGRFGGHIVSGHIDGTGTVSSLRQEGNAVWVTIAAGPELLRGIVEKGSIAIDGISLTVADVTEQDFSVSIIPHTGGQTTLLQRRPGDTVNLETDIIGKYVARLMAPANTPASGGITREFLTQYGF